jgi:hypothetical protein
VCPGPTTTNLSKLRCTRSPGPQNLHQGFLVKEPDMDMYIAIGCLVISTLLGLSVAWYNINDDEGRQRRIEQRRKQRKARKRLW